MQYKIPGRGDGPFAVSILGEVPSTAKTAGADTPGSTMEASDTVSDSDTRSEVEWRTTARYTVFH